MNYPEKTKQHAPAIPSRRYTPGKYTDESVRFLQQRISKKDFETIMHNADGRTHPYVAARVFLSEADWAKYVWIEQHGSLEGFEGAGGR